MQEASSDDDDAPPRTGWERIKRTLKRARHIAQESEPRSDNEEPNSDDNEFINDEDEE